MKKHFLNFLKIKLWTDASPLHGVGCVTEFNSQLTFFNAEKFDFDANHEYSAWHMELIGLLYGFKWISSIIDKEKIHRNQIKEIHFINDNLTLINNLKFFSLSPTVNAILFRYEFESIERDIAKRQLTSITNHNVTYSVHLDLLSTFFINLGFLNINSSFICKSSQDSTEMNIADKLSKGLIQHNPHLIKSNMNHYPFHSALDSLTTFLCRQPDIEPRCVDYVSLLNEFCQLRKLQLPSYVIISNRLNMVFIAEVFIGDAYYQGVQEQPSKTGAKQEAARQACIMMNIRCLD